MYGRLRTAYSNVYDHSLVRLRNLYNTYIYTDVCSHGHHPVVAVAFIVDHSAGNTLSSLLTFNSNHQKILNSGLFYLVLLIVIILRLVNEHDNISAI